ncbi:stage V sporulation protein B [Jeotgalibacillus haloalkalitolerans]|uniref:Stage V sporulation protein B n=1 Tax=Jeotgalibacillus haloalkalitolerans TaxID=3104292 RepID=A0ABU5KM35_9BACL|nr:stage V sporulation protein B [Jeotgalibacillus sp. HH7-29]MDZ5712332.1 stage V sporulation protein B [Jeotgalibacillus sp. HH7-29]
MSKLIKGTLLLMAAALVTKVLGFVHRIILADMAGAEGVGLYMMTFPALMLAITVTQLGLPIAISKYVSEAAANKNEQEIRKILSVSLWITGSLAVLLTPLLFFAAPYISTVLLNDERTLIPFIAVLPIIPIAAFSAVVRGYFMGRQQMGITAIGSVLEQTIRILLLVAAVGFLSSKGPAYAAGGAMLAAVIGELCSLLFLLVMFKTKKTKLRGRSENSFRETANQLLKIALPSAGSRFVGSAAWFLEPIIVMKCLVFTGMAATAVTAEYGLLTGFVLPVLLLPSFITVSLSMALVPSISEARALSQDRVVMYRITQSLRLSAVTGTLCCLILFLEGETILTLLYGSAEGLNLLKLMALFFIFYYYQGPLHAVLQAFEAAGKAMVNSITGSIIKLLSMAGLMIYFEDITGAAIGLAIGTAAVTFLHFHSVRKMTRLSLPIGQYAAIALVSACCWLIHTGILSMSAPVRILILILIFCFLASRVQLIQRDDWSFLKSFKKN